MATMVKNKEELYWLWLTQTKGIGPVKQHQLLRFYGKPSQIFEALKEESNINPAIFSLENAKKIQHQCNEKNIKILTLNDELPQIFSEEPTLPTLLYAKGQDVPLKRGWGIVGARRCTSNAKSTAIMLATDAVCHNQYVISGMAKGIDSYAHTCTIKENGITVAVLGNGLDHCYPSEHQTLMEKIQQTGLTISEYPPGVLPRTYNFPRRNRIIAALSTCLHVIEPGKSSGTRTTMEAASKYNIPTEIWK